MTSRILVVEHRTYKRRFYRELLEWIALNLPGCRGRFDVRTLTKDIAPEGFHTLMVPWLQDPLQHWSPMAYDNTMRLQDLCDAAGIPVVNRVERLDRAGKDAGARLMREAGLRTPRTFLITDREAFKHDFGGLAFPFFVRGDWGHTLQMIPAWDAEAARAIPLENFLRPVAIEMILLPDPQDRLYRKYRYVVAGPRGVPHHMQASQDWITRGEARVTNDRTRAEELAYIDRPCEHHELFQRAQQRFGLDILAFDYAIDEEGRVLAWEANPFPTLKFARSTTVHRNEAMHRTFAVMTAFYLEQAGIEVPARLQDYLAGNPSIVPASTPRTHGAVPQWKVPPKLEPLPEIVVTPAI